jgi:putative lipoic acid-binding regulatory protein
MASLPPEVPPERSLIEYPSVFPIKVMGLQVGGFVEAMVSVALQFDPGFQPATVEQRPSSGGKYLGITLTVTATSREQLDELYRTLSTHPMVKVVL